MIMHLLILVLISPRLFNFTENCFYFAASNPPEFMYKA